MPQKLSYEEVKNIVENAGMKLLTEEYVNNRTKLLVNKDGYLGYTTIDAIRSNKNFLYFFKTNPFSIQNIQKYLDERKTGAKILTEEYKNNVQKLKLQCKCGEIFYRCLSDIQQTNYVCCEQCTIKLRSDKRREDDDTVIREFANKNYIILENNYKNVDTRIRCQNEEGYRGTLSLRGLRSGHELNPFNPNLMSKEDYIYNINLLLKKNNRKVQVLDYLGKNNDYVTNLLLCKCPICNQPFEIPMATLRWGKDSCYTCINTVSKNASKVEDWLKSNNVIYQNEKKFECCADIKPLPFDFYLPKYNTCIEVDGEQHYRPVNFGGISDEKAKEYFKIVKKHDNMKNNYCKLNNINLIRIPYWEFNNNDDYKTILTNNIKD